jgi:hypothetical protein
MGPARFASLRTHSWFSLGEGASSPEQLLERAAAALQRGVEADALGPPARYYLPFSDWVEAGRPSGDDGPRPAA